MNTRYFIFFWPTLVFSSMIVLGLFETKSMAEGNTLILQPLPIKGLKHAGQVSKDVMKVSDLEKANLGRFVKETNGDGRDYIEPVKKPFGTIGSVTRKTTVESHVTTKPATKSQAVKPHGLRKKLMLLFSLYLHEKKSE